MFNLVMNSKQSLETASSVEVARSLIDGHHKFMVKNTGETYDPTVQHFICNEEGVLSNNRHFIAHTQMEYQPNGDGTTEGQSLEVLGYVYAYLATGNKVYLDAAVWHWEAYVKYYYAGQAIPDTAERWICNWIVNSKEPSLSNWPINATNPTQGGYKCVPLLFIDGEAQIPHGSPFWGEYLDVATFAHRGHMTWDAINGSVQALENEIDWQEVYDKWRVTTMPSEPYSSVVWVDWNSYLGKDNYTPNWNKKIDTLPSNWINVWTQNKIGIGKGPNDELWDGEIIEENIPLADVGKVQLVDRTINGVYLYNYAVRLPVADGGYQFKRNQVWHNRPINTPLLGSVNQMGNAADAEQWFADACYMLWKITSEDRYKKALDACLFTAYEYTDIDSGDRFFRKNPPNGTPSLSLNFTSKEYSVETISSGTPFTDGISYDFTYPSGVDVSYGRNSYGYITASTTEPLDLSLEQQAVSFRISQESKVRVTYGGVGNSGSVLTAVPRLILTSTKQETTGVEWIAALPNSVDATVKEVDVPMNQFVRAVKDDGSAYILADVRSINSSDDIIVKSEYEENVLDGRNVQIVDINFPDDEGYCQIGFYLLEGKKAKMQSITYKADKDYNLRFQDDERWNYWWMLPDTKGEWVTKVITPSGGTLSGYQPNEDGRERPTTGPVYDMIEEFSILFDDSDSKNGNFSYYCINDIPPRCTDSDGYTLNFRLTLGTTDTAGMSALIGDCTVIDYRLDSLSYTPGLIPFSNIYEDGTDQIGAWHGMPYPGYQYPFIYTVSDSNQDVRLTNMVDFLYDAQQWYFSRFGELGPVASAYVWNRWDNIKYGSPDTFTMYHWGDGKAWSGYQPRAFQGACRAWLELTEQGKPVPTKLKAYVENWITWLIKFVKNSGGITPTDFPTLSVPVPVDDDFTGHMCGLWLSGACMAAMAGLDDPEVGFLIDVCLAELRNNFDVTSIPDNNMNGSWSPALRLDSDNGMFFGFHSGEILRGLGTYMIYKSGLTPDKMIERYTKL